VISETLQANDFSTYPPQAAKLARAHASLLGELPKVFAAALLREVIGYDWKFPVECRQLEGQLGVLEELSADELKSRMQGFADIGVSAELERANWVADPAGFMERLTTWLWSSGQMVSFSRAAGSYAEFLAKAYPSRRPLSPRLGIVVIGQGVDRADQPLFRKLRPHGLYLDHVKPDDGWPIISAAAIKRAADSELNEYRHWYIDGGVSAPAPGLTQISYEGLQRPRELLLSTIQQAIDSGSMGPEGLRTLIARLGPEEIGLGGQGDDAILGRFKLSVLTEGSGTQIFSTTFVQWSARECLRRAQPETLLLRYACRQQVQPMNIMLSAEARSHTLDPQGSLIDADMGAYYTWINMNRLAGADQMSFLVWYENQRQAIAIGPNLPQRTTSDTPMDMSKVLALLG
jgi:hypothetical protein